MKNSLKQKLLSIPESPGCYLWKDNNGNVLYIGKANNLKKRTQQYFNPNQSFKTQKLVAKICDVDYFVVNNENESLILENNLIKKHKPPFNILLKDGNSTFPYIVITNEKDPRIIYTRNPQFYQGKKYGPFASNQKKSGYQLFLLLNKMFGFRKCNKLPKTTCMYYHLGQCLAPCINKINESTYEQMKQEVNDILNNKTHSFIQELKQKEKRAADDLKFEEAKLYYDYVSELTSINFKQVVELQKKFDIDIIGYYEKDNLISIMIFSFIDGKLLAKHEFLGELNQECNEAVEMYLNQYYSTVPIPKMIYLNIDDNILKRLSNIYETKFIKPVKGTYMELMVNAINNAKEYLLKNKLKIDDKHKRTQGANEQLRTLLSLDKLERIDVIDNSNIFLEDPISGVVVFENGIANKQLYRKYNLRALVQKSDYHFMQEVILRRYSNVDNIPDLIILDGGKLQVSAANEMLEQMELTQTINLIGLKKNNHHQTDTIVKSDLTEIKIDKDSYLYKYLSQMQNEVHRFAINTYRKKNIKSKLNDFLDNIDGLGAKSKQKLIKLYPNIYDLKGVSLATLEQFLSKKAATNLYNKIKKELK